MLCPDRSSALFVLTPDPKVDPDDAIPRFGNPHPVGGPDGSGARESTASWTAGLEDKSGDEFDQFRRHAGDFIECVRTRRQPVSDLEGAHRVATACHLANLSLRLGRKLRWDSARESIIDDKEAEALLERPYRPPWDAKLKALGIG